MSKRLHQINLDSYKPLREVVEETLREAIISGLLEPGERLMEVELAEDMGVSRTPVREAIRKLEQEGYVVIIPRKGTYVAKISYQDVKDVFEIRTVLEGLAAGLAAERVTAKDVEEIRSALAWEAGSENLGEIVRTDTDFHALLYQMSGNSRLSQILANLREQMQRFRTTSLAKPGRVDEALEEHLKIVEAIAERDGAKAKELAEYHMQQAAQLMFETVEEDMEISK